MQLQTVTTITQKGQVTIPQYMRLKLGLSGYDKVRVKSGKGHVKIFPTKDIVDIAGTFVPKRKKSVLKARLEMEKGYARF